MTACPKILINGQDCPLKAGGRLGATQAPRTHQLVAPLDLLLDVVHGEAPDVLALRVRGDQCGGEELEGRATVNLTLSYLQLI